MELKATRFEVDGHVATVWLHRPQRHNAWTGRMHTEYRWILAELEADPAVRAVVVTGTPPAFCVGGDSEALAGHAVRGSYDTGLGDAPATPGHGVRPEFDHEFAFQFGMRMPLIAAVNGACAGIGLAVAMFCDLRFVSGPARMTTAAAKLGLPAEYGLSWILPRLVGVTRANDLLFSGRVFTATETADWGLWNGVCVDGTETLVTALAYAHLLASTTGPRAVAATKRQVYDDLLSHDVGRSIVESKRLMSEAMATAEYREGVAALRERRPPNFS
ncbi:MAG: putative enoyl-CoA hydratase [Ilumatobacteraceae bacterium]|nr:putative enoyl-CoA hydratase [Ilumatobacteraceae bacterium]